MNNKKLLYSGKVKSLYETEDKDCLVMEFSDDATAFNALKKEKFAGKGTLNNKFNAFIMEKLQEADIPVHFQKLLSDNESLVKHLKMIPVEAVVRNYTAGSLCKRLQIEEGKELIPPVFEFFYKSDALGDPFINESHIITFGWADAAAIERIKDLTLHANLVLKRLFDAAGLMLVDFKLEFGYFNNELMLGDEFTLDGCRVWDKKTKEIYDKDRFRKDLGGLLEFYQQAAERLGLKL